MVARVSTNWPPATPHASKIAADPSAAPPPHLLWHSALAVAGVAAAGVRRVRRRRTPARARGSRAPAEASSVSGMTSPPVERDRRPTALAQLATSLVNPDRLHHAASSQLPPQSHPPAAAAMQADRSAMYARRPKLGRLWCPNQAPSTVPAARFVLKFARVDRPRQALDLCPGSSPHSGHDRRSMGCEMCPPAHPRLRRHRHPRCCLFCLPSHSASDVRLPDHTCRCRCPAPFRGPASPRRPAMLPAAA